MRPFRIALTIVAALALAGPAQASDRARVWMTTGDKVNLLTEQPRSSMGAPGAGLPTITVDASTPYQRMEGWGASITDSSAHVIAESRQRDAIMRDLFDRRHGIGLSYLRQPMGASDFVKGPHYTY